MSELITPIQYEILLPLKEWRILSILDLKNIVRHEKSNSAFYKTISKLEKNGFIKGFQNPWTKEKYLYLLPNALKTLGEDKYILPINLDQIFHDSIVTRVALQLKGVSRIEEVYLDSNIPKYFPVMENTPDILAVGATENSFKLAIEIELSQKSKPRLREIFKSYSNSKVINNVIYLTDKKSIFDFYTNFLKEEGSELKEEKFIFIHEKNLRLKGLDILNSTAFFKNNITNLKNLLKV
jgi:hypothetical protein